MCRALKVAPSELYAWRHKPLSIGTSKISVFSEKLIHASYAASHGYPRLVESLPWLRESVSVHDLSDREHFALLNVLRIRGAL